MKCLTPIIIDLAKEEFLDFFEKRSALFKEPERVSIITTSQGPFYPDMFWLVESSSGIGIFPSEDRDSDFLSEAQDLPGFDNEMVITAASSSEDKIFVCWERKA